MEECGHQEIRMAATMVPWSDVVPDEIRSTDLIAQVGAFGEMRKQAERKHLKRDGTRCNMI